MPDLRKLYKTLKSNAPDYIKESEQDFVNKWKGSEDKLYDQLSSEVDGFKDIASPRDEYVKLAKSSGGKGAGFIESQMQKADTYSKDVVSSNNKANLTKLSNSNKPTNTVPADSGLKPLSEVLSDNPIAQNNIKAALAYKDMYRKASTLPSDISVTDFIENSPVTKAMKSQYDDADLDQLGKERGTYDITMNGLDNYRAAYATTRQKHKAELNKQFGSGTFDKVENDLNTIYVALNNLGEPKTDKQKEIYNGYIKKIQGIKDSHKDMMDSPAFKEIQGLDSRLSEADQLEAKVEEETPVYQEHRKLVDKIQSQVDSEDGSHIRSYTDAVLRSSMRTADRVLDAIGAATNNDSMRERARVGMEMNPAATYNKRNLREQFVDIDGKTYVVGPKSKSDETLVLSEEKTSNGSFVSLPKDMQGKEVPSNVKPYTKVNYGSMLTSVADVASDMLVTSAITTFTAGLGMLTAGAVGGVAALRKIQNVGKITSAMSNVNSLTKKSQYLGSILGNGLQAMPGYVDRATKEGTSEDDLLLGKLATGLLYGIESNLNPVELKLTDKIFGLGEKTMSKTLIKFLNGEIKLADILVHTGKTLGKSVLGENIEENILEPFIDEGVSAMNAKLYDHDYKSSFPTQQEIETTVATTTLFSVLTGGFTGNFSKNSLIKHSAKVLMEDKAGTLKILDLLESNNPEKFTDNLSKIRDVVKQVEAAGLSKKAETELTTLLFNRTITEQKKTDADNQVSSFKYDKQLEGIDARIQSLISSNTTTAVNQATPITSSTPTTGNTTTATTNTPATGETKAKPAVTVKSDDTHTTLTINGEQGEATFRKTNNGRTWSAITQDENGNEVVTKLEKSFVDDYIKPKLEEAKQNEKEAVAKSVEAYNTGKERVIEGVDKSKVSTEEVTSIFDHIGDMIDEGTSPDEIKAVLDEAADKKGVAAKVRYIQQKLGNKLPDEVLYSIKQMLSGSKEGVLGLHSLGDMVQFHEKNSAGRTASINPNNKVTVNEVTTKTAEIAELKKQKTALEQQRKGFLNKDSKRAKSEALALTGKIEELSGQIKSKNQELIKAKKAFEISNKLNNSKQVEVTDIDKINSDIAAIDTELSSVRSDKKASIDSNPNNYEPGKTSKDTDKLSAKERDLVERKKELEAIKKELEGDNTTENEMVADVSYPKNAKPSNKKSSFTFKKNKTISTPNGSYTYLGKSKNENGRVFHSFKMDNGFTARLYEDTHIKSLQHLFDNSNSDVSTEAKNTLKRSAEIATENAAPKTPSESFIKSIQRGIRSIKARRLAKKLNKVFPGISLSFDNKEALNIISRFDLDEANKKIEQDKKALVLADNNVQKAASKFDKTGSKVSKNNLAKAIKNRDVARETVNESIRKANKIVENYENNDFKQIKSADGTITLGFYDPSTGTIHLDENNLDYETPIHEFGHIWNIFARAQYPELYAKGLELIQGSEYHKEILSNPAYSHLSEEEVLDEALATAIGRAGDDIFNSNKRNSFLTFLNDLFSAIGEAMGFKSAANTSKKSFQDITLSEFINGVADEMLNGDIKNEGDINIMQEYGDLIFNKIFEPDNTNQKLKRSAISSKIKLDNFYTELVGLLPNDLDPNSKLLKLPSQSMHGFSDKDAPYKSQYEITQDIINSDLPESVKDDYHKLLNENIKAIRKAVPNNINDNKKSLSVQDNKELKSESEREMLTNIAVSGGLSVSKVIDDFKNWVKTGISSFKNLVKEYAKVIGTTSLLFIHTPISISEYTGPNDIRVSSSIGTITELFNREALVNGEELNEKALDKALSIWNKTGRAEIIVDDAFITGDTLSNLRAFAEPDWYKNPKRPIKVLANITDINDFIAELSHMVQFSSEPNWVSKERKYNSQQEYDAHSIIEPLLMEHILNDTPIDSLLNEGGADWFGVNLSHMKKVVDANKLHDLLKDNTSNKQPAVRVTGLKRMAVSDNTNTTNNPADLMDNYLKERISKGLTPEYDAFVNDPIYNEAGITPNYIKARFNNLVEKSPQKAYSNIANILNLPELIDGDLAKAIEKGNSIANRNLESKGTKVMKGSLKEKISNDTTGFYEFISKTSDELSNKGYHTVLHDNFDSFANDVDAAGFDLSNALKNNVLVLGNTVHIFDNSKNDNLVFTLSQVDNISTEQATELSKVIDTVYNNIAKRLGKTVEEFKRSIAIRTVSDVSSFIKDIPGSISSLLGLSNQIINDFTNITQDNLAIDYQSIFNTVPSKYIKNLGLTDSDFILASLLESEESFNFLGFDKKLSGLGNKEKITEEINKRLLFIRDRAMNTNDFFIQELSPSFLTSSLKNAKTEAEKESIQAMIDGDSHSINANIVNLQSIQRANLLSSLNYLIPSSEYPAEFKYFMIGSILKGNLAKDVVIYEDDGITVKTTILGEKAKRNNKTVGNHQELSSMVLPDVYNEFKNGTDVHPIKLIDKYTDKSFITRDETWDIVKDKVFKETNDGYWVKFEKSTNESDIKALSLVSKKVAKVMTSNPWCTGGGMASTYLPKGDFYLFLDKTLEPQITIRYDGGNIAEVKGTDSGQALSASQSDIAKDFLPYIPQGSNYEKQVKASSVYHKLKNNIEFTKQDLQDYFDTYNVNLETYDGSKGEEFIELKDEFINKAIELNSVYNIYTNIVKQEYSLYEFILQEGDYVLGNVTFSNDTLPKGFTIPSGVTFGGNVSFYNATLPKGFTIPSGVTFGGNVDFGYATLPEGFTIPSGVTFGGNVSFYKATLPEGFTIPSGVTFGGDVNFSNATLPDGFTIPSGVTFGGNVDFSNATLPEGFTIPSGVTFGGNVDFSYATLPDGFTIPSGVTFGGDVNFSNATLPEGFYFDIIEYKRNNISVDNQDKRGVILRTDKSTLILLDKNNADVTSPIHEITHKFEDVLTKEEVAIVEKWSNSKKGTKKFKEAFAKGAEKYIYEGVTFNGKMDRIFHRLKEWFKDIISDAITYFGDINQLNADIRNIYSKMLIDSGEINLDKINTLKIASLNVSKNNTKTEIKVKTLGLTMSDNPFKFSGLTELLVQKADKDNIQNTIASDEFIKALSNVKNDNDDKKLKVLETLNKAATSDNKLNIEDIPAIVDELVRLAEKSKDIPLPFVNYGEMESIEIAIDHSPKLKRSAKGPGKVDRGDTRIDDIKTAINKHREIPPEVWRAILSTPDKKGELPLSGRAFNEVIGLATSNYKASIAQAQSLKTNKVLKVLKNGSVIADMIDFNNSVVDSDRILTQDFLKEVANIAEESPGMIKSDGRFPDVGSSVPKFTFMEVLDDVRHHNLHNIEQGSATANKIENNVLVSKSEVVGLGFALNTIFGTIQTIQGRIDDGDLSPQDLKSYQNELYIWKEHYRIMHNAFLKIGSETGGMLAIFRRKLVSIVEQDPMFFKNTLLTDPAIKNNKKLSRDVGALADEVTLNKAEVERLTNKGDEYNVINKTADEVFLSKKKEIESAAKVDNTGKIDSIVEQLISIARSNMTTDQARTAISDPNRIKRSAISGTPFNADMESSKRSALLYDLGVALMEQYPNRVLTFEDLTEIIQTKMGSQGKSVTAAEVRVAFASTHKDVIQRTVDIKRKQLEDVKKQARIIAKLGTLLEGMALDKTHVTINNTVFYQVPTGPDSYVNKWVKSELVGGSITQVDANAAEEALIQKEVNKIGVTITDPVHTAGVPKLFIRVSDPSNLGNYWADSITMTPANETEKSLISKQIKKDTSASKLGTPSLHKSAVILDASNNKHLFIITEEGKWVTVSNPLTNEMREADPSEMALIHNEVAKKGPYTEIQRLLVDLLKHSSSMNTIMGTAQQAAFLNHILQIKEEIPGALSGLTIDNSTIDRMLAKVTNMKELASLDKLENTKKAVEKSIETLLAGDDKKAIAEILAKAMKPDVPHQSREVILAKQRLRESQASLNKIIQGATRDKYKSNFRKFRLLTQTFKGLPASGDLSAHLIQGIAVSIKNIFYFNYWKGAKSVLKGGPLSDFISDRQKLVAKGNKHSITSFGKNGLAKASEFYNELTQHPYYAKMVQAGLGLSDPSVVDDPAEDLFREDLLDELNSMVIDKIDRNLTGNTAKAAKVATKLLTGTTIKQTSEASYLSTLNAHRAAMFIAYMDSQKALNRPTTAASEEQAARSINDLTMKSSKIGSLNLNKQLEVAGYFLWAPKMYLAATKFVPNLLWKPIALGKQVYTSRKVNNELTKLGKLKAAIQSVGTRTTEEQKLIDNFRDKNNLPVATSSDANVEEKILMDINEVKGKLVESQAMQGALRFSAFEHYSSLASIVGLNLAVLAMLKRFCKEPDTAGIQLDPTESSFLKVGCGGIYRDLTGNLSGYIKTTLQFSAKVMDYWGSSPVMKGNSYYNESTPGSILYEFYSRKLSPAFSMVSNTAFNMDFYGQPIHRPLMGFDDLIPAVGESINYSLSNIEPLVFRELLNISNNTYDINGLLGYMNPTFLDNLNTFKNDPMLRAVAIPSTIVITAMGASLKERNTYDIKSVVKDKASKYDINFGNRNDQINFEPPSAKGIMAIAKGEREAEKLTLNKDKFMYNKCKNLIVNTAEPFIRNMLDKIDKGDIDQITAKREIIAEVDRIKKDVEQYYKNEGMEWGYERIYRQKAMIIAKDAEQIKALDPKNAEKTGTFPGDKSYVDLVFNRNNLKVDPDILKLVNDAAKEEMIKQGFVKYGAKPQPLVGKLRY